MRPIKIIGDNSAHLPYMTEILILGKELPDPEVKWLTLTKSLGFPI